MCNVGSVQNVTPKIGRVISTKFVPVRPADGRDPVRSDLTKRNPCGIFITHIISDDRWWSFTKRSPGYTWL